MRELLFAYAAAAAPAAGGIALAWQLTTYAEDRLRAEAALVAELGGDAGAEARLERAQTLSKLLNGAGVVLTLWAFTKPQPYALVVGALAAAPWLALAVAALSKGVIRLDRKRNSPHPHLAFLFLMPTLALGMRAAFDLSLTSPAQLLLPAAGAAAPMMALWLSIERNREQQERLLAFVFVFAYAAAAVAMATSCSIVRRPQCITPA